MFYFHQSIPKQLYRQKHLLFVFCASIKTPANLLSTYKLLLTFIQRIYSVDTENHGERFTGQNQRVHLSQEQNNEDLYSIDSAP